MRKPRSPNQDFNPEKFLQAEAKKQSKAAHPFHSPLRKLITLEANFKAELIAGLDQAHPNLFESGSTEAHEVFALGGGIHAFVKRALAKEKMRVSANVLHRLTCDLLETMALRHLEKKKARPDAPGDKTP